MSAPVVIFRTVSVEKMSPVLDACGAKWQGHPLWVVSSPSRVGELNLDGRVDRVLKYEGVAAGFDRPLKQDLKAVAVVVPVANKGGSGYGNVLRVAAGIRSTSFCLCSRCRLIEESGRIEFLRKALLEAALRFVSRWIAGRLLK